jgi:hypothetical protein
MRDMGLMSDTQIGDTMQIYREALVEAAVRWDARKQADAILGGLFVVIRDGMEEERKKGTSEAEIHHIATASAEFVPAAPRPKRTAHREGTRRLS